MNSTCTAVIPKRNFARRANVCLCALVGLLCLASGRASASCGDYVTWRGKPQHNAMSNDASQAPSQNPAPAAPSPCKNGNCQQAPADLPPSAPATIVSLSSSHRAVPVNADFDLYSPSQSFIFAERTLLDDGHPASIDHPPRNI